LAESKSKIRNLSTPWPCFARCAAHTQHHVEARKGSLLHQLFVHAWRLVFNIGLFFSFFLQSGKKDYSLPTSDELNNLRETQELFKSNLFKLQIDELLKEIRISMDNSRGMQQYLQRLKKLIDSIPEQQVYCILLLVFVRHFVHFNCFTVIRSTYPMAAACWDLSSITAMRLANSLFNRLRGSIWLVLFC
jgi:hypothetical protein